MPPPPESRSVRPEASRTCTRGGRGSTCTWKAPSVASSAGGGTDASSPQARKSSMNGSEKRRSVTRRSLLRGPAQRDERDLRRHAEAHGRAPVAGALADVDPGVAEALEAGHVRL